MEYGIYTRRVSRKKTVLLKGQVAVQRRGAARGEAGAEFTRHVRSSAEVNRKYGSPGGEGRKSLQEACRAKAGRVRLCRRPSCRTRYMLAQFKQRRPLTALRYSHPSLLCCAPPQAGGASRESQP